MTKASLINPIRRVLESATPVPPEDLSQYTDEINRLKAELQKCDEFLAGPRLGIESAQTFSVQDHRKKVEERLEKLLRLEKVSQRFRQLGLEPLTWRNGSDLPQLAIFRLDRGGMDMSAGFHVATGGAFRRASVTPRPDGRGGFSIHPHFPREISVLYQDIPLVLAERALYAARRRSEKYGSFYDVHMRATFNSILPLEIRQTIEVVKDDFEDIFVIAEARWDIEARHVPPDPDPLVVGWLEGQMFLIANFDMTTAEKAMALNMPKTSRN